MFVFAFDNYLKQKMKYFKNLANEESASRLSENILYYFS